MSHFSLTDSRYPETMDGVELPKGWRTLRQTWIQYTIPRAANIVTTQRLLMPCPTMTALARNSQWENPNQHTA